MFDWRRFGRAYVMTTRIPMPLETERYEYSIEGNPNGVFFFPLGAHPVDHTIVPKEGDFWVGQYHFIVLDYEIFSDSVICCLANRHRVWWLKLRSRLHYRYEDIKLRLQLTLYVWGLRKHPRNKYWRM